MTDTNPAPAGDSDTPKYLDTALPFDRRAEDLVSRMTVEEKIAQTVNAAPAIERLGVPEYEWWNECLHGVGRAGIATVFPQAIGLAATWNTELMHRVATAISDEARAKHHDAVGQGNRGRYYGLTYWTPNINIFRDPRWGRGQETYGEDPHLTGRMGVAFVTGLQGDDEKYLKLVATPKHYAVHNGPESLRHSFDAKPSPRDLWETYLPAFEDCVVEAGAVSVMGAYNAVDGVPCCCHRRLLQDILRDRWGFDGYVVSDCGGVCDIYKNHQYVETPEQAAAVAVNAGCDLNCGDTYLALRKAVRDGLISEQTLDTVCRRLFTARMRLGMFDPPEMVPYAKTPMAVNDSDEHRELAARTARESIVLLRNAGGLLPLSRDVSRIAVIGPNADDADLLLGNYNGTPSRSVTPLAGIRAAVSDATEVVHAPGCSLKGKEDQDFSEAVEAAAGADAVVMVLGLSPRLEGEEGEAEDSEGGGDRIHLTLPGRQEDLLRAVCETGKPVVLVLTGGSALAFPWAAENVPSILFTWYGGEEGGTALADVLFGAYNPAGRLPVTFYRSADDLPPFEDYNMDGRTYRYFTGEPLYPFGYGLSYTRFAYDTVEVAPQAVAAGAGVEVTATVENVGDVAGDEVVQLYVSRVNAPAGAAIRKLAGFTRVHLEPGQKTEVAFAVRPKELSSVESDGELKMRPGTCEVSVGGGQPIAATGETGYATARFEVAG